MPNIVLFLTTELSQHWVHDMTEKYPHLLFRRHWELRDSTLMLLGQCEAYVQAISNTPILPQHQRRLLQVSLVKGAQATTAIEGNTLSQEEIEQIVDGGHLPPSKEYQETEVKNVIDALNTLLHEIVGDGSSNFISPQLLQRFHAMIGNNLGDPFDALPGRFRTDNRVVGRYRCPDYSDVEKLVQHYCEWLLQEFHYNKGQSFSEVVIQAIVSHVYLEWIHPFGDGNGRTGRLLEFYILLRGGLPDIASHILSNYYNQTRPQYYFHFENAQKKQDLSDFIDYALLGLRDGLVETLRVIHQSQQEITWQKYVYDAFSARVIGQKEVFMRQRSLALNLPHDQRYSIDNLVVATPAIAKAYANISDRTVRRDLQSLRDMELIIIENSLIRTNIDAIRHLVARRKT